MKVQGFRKLSKSLSLRTWLCNNIKVLYSTFQNPEFSLSSFLAQNRISFCGFLFICLLLFGLVSFRWPQHKDFNSEHQPYISVEKTPSRAGQAIVFLGVSITTWVGYSRDLKENINNGIRSQKPGCLPSAVTQQQKPLTSLGLSSFPLANRVELDPL